MLNELEVGHWPSAAHSLRRRPSVAQDRSIAVPEGVPPLLWQVGRIVIIVGADNITLNLNGHTISGTPGPGDGNAAGVRVPNRTGVGDLEFAGMSDVTPSLPAIWAHGSSVVLPILGPAVVLIVTWRDQYVREHSAVALLLSSSVTAVVFIASELAGGGLVLLILSVVVLATLAALNIQRVHRGEPPLLRG